MDHFSSAWNIVKENLGPWIILGLVYMVLNSVTGGLAALLITPNLFRAIGKAVDQNIAPEVGDLFNFDNIGEDVVAMLLYGVAAAIGSIICGVGVIIPMVLFFWVPVLASEGRYAAVESMKASLAHAKENLGPVVIFIVLAAAINTVASILCLLPLLLTMPITFVAMWLYFRQEQANIHQAAATAGVPTR